nr:acyl-CoA dehydrogenase [Streptomyces viridosporus]
MTLLTFRTNACEVTGGPLQDDLPGSLPQLISPLPAAGELTHLLFDQDNQGDIHQPWRNLIAQEQFRHAHGLSPEERTTRSYARLRLVNNSLSSAEALTNDPHRLASLHEWTGVVDATLGTLSSIHYNLFLGSLYDHDAVTSRDLADFTSLRRTGTFLCTELEHGNDAASLQTTATFDRAADCFILHTPTPAAQKCMPNTGAAGGPKSALVAARLLIDGQDQGVFLFLTPVSDEAGPLPGITVRPLPERIGHPFDHSLTSFDQVRLPREALLEAEHGRLAPQGTLSSSLGNRRKRFLRSLHRVLMGKLCMSAAAVGVSRASLAIAVRYAHARYISGPRAGQRIPLVAHRSHHGRLLYGIATAYAMTFLHREVVSQWARHIAGEAAQDAESRAELERLVAITKSWTTWQARDIAIECRERCGALGLFPVNCLADITANVEGTITAEGDNLVIALKAAAEMLFGHRSRKGRSAELPVVEQHLTDLGFLRDLLGEAEALWQERARRDLRQGPAGDPVSRWNGASSAALKMVDIHARLQAADALLAAAGQAVGPAARDLLHQLARLFLLKEISEHTGDLLAEGFLTAGHIRRLPAAIDEVVAELAPHMMTLVEAFDLPDEFFSGIPIANDDYTLRWNELADSLAADC